MQQILVYSDSLSWGIVPTTRKRLPFDARWPGVMEITLTEQRHRVRVIEDCLNADQHHSLGRALARCVAALPGVLPPATS